MTNERLPFLPPQLDQYIDYCWVEAYFNEEEVSHISALFDASEAKSSATVSSRETGEVVEDLRKSTVAFLEPGGPQAAELIDKLARLAIQVNTEKYRFDLMGFYEPIQVAEYGEGDFFDWHNDFSQGLASTRKLSLSVQLSDPSDYEGGDLQFHINTKLQNAPRTKGTVIIFPSFVPHRVTPITAGKRRSMVGWVTGVPFR